jgi:2',3'-cyclic-nucleotide 2'-phosphodiesterase (5'-nucleotidase family)
MPSLRPSFALCFSVVALALAACTSVSKTENPASSALKSPLTILYQQGREGQLEPCGCHSAPYGGIDRELNAVRAIRAANSKVLFVDAGNLFAPIKSKTSPDMLRMHGEALVGALNEMGMNVYGPGPADYALGLKWLREIQAKAKFKFVATNVVDAKGATAFAPYEIIDVGGVPVAVFAVLEEKTKLGSGLKVTNPVAALTKAMAETSSKAQLTVVLSSLGKHSKDRQLAQELPGINVLIGNDPDLTMQNADPRGATLLTDGHRFAYFLGKLDIELMTPIKGFYSDAGLKVNQNALTGYEAALKNQTSPQRRAELEAKVAEFKKNEMLTAPAGASKFENVLIALSEQAYGQKNELTAVIEAEKNRTRDAAINGATPAAPKK